MANISNRYDDSTGSAAMNLHANQATAQRKSHVIKPLPVVGRYALGILTVSLALGGSLIITSLQFRGAEIPMFLFAIAASAWYGDVEGAVTALFLSAAAFDYFFTPPLYSLSISRANLPYYVIFVLFALLVTWFSTVRRRVEQELIQARDRLQIEVAERTQQASLLNLTHDSIFVRDMNFMITYWNRGAEELYGWTAEEAAGKESQGLLQTVYPIPIDDVIAELQRSGRWEAELRRTKADGVQVVVAARWSLRRDERGQPAAILETSNDISETKRRQEEVERLNEELARRSADLEGTNKELEAFAYSVSHDLRAPLRHMAGYAELLQKRVSSALDEKSQRYMAMMLESAKRMGDLIDDLLAFSRIGRAETRKTLVSLDQLVREALTELRQDTEGRAINWKIGALPECHGDRSMLRLALLNLMSNAVKFTRTRSPAEIEIGSTSGINGDVVVFIKDNGVGFDMKYVHKLFGVFQRLHQSDTFEGTGIGLATVQRILHRHGGRVWAEGVIDEGATFYFSAPKA
jgi:PAS domain S-box-containing protein